jgi:hypothetical protein
VGISGLLSLGNTDNSKLSQAMEGFAKKGNVSDWSLFVIVILLLFLATAIQHSSRFAFSACKP